MVIGHHRTEHLQKVLDSISNATNSNEVTVLIQLQNPTSDVLTLVEKWPKENKSVFVIRGEFKNTMSAINNNVFSGIHNAFTKLEAEYCLILEDDIVLMPTALQYVARSFEKYGKNRKFRGVNCFSKTKITTQSEFLVAKSNYGFAWGWAIDKRTFLKISKFWTGNENNHWDFILEPFARTGFVVNPFASQIVNIGFDSSATHSSQDGLLGQEILQSAKSWSQEIESISEGLDIKYEWSDSLYDLKILGTYERIKLELINSLTFFVSLAEKRFPYLEVFRMRLIRSRKNISRGSLKI